MPTTTSHSELDAAREEPQPLELKPWSTPELVRLDLNETAGGAFIEAFEGPYDFIFYS